jgi:SAM-dependent methyltransferase
MSAAPVDAALLDAAFVWDVRNWSRAVSLWQPMIDLHHPRHALALGERQGGLSLWLAARGIEVVCTDLRPSFGPARALHQQYGVADLVTYEVQDATAITWADGSFDLVVFKSVIGALQTKDRQLQAIREMHRVLAPGGLLLFAENLIGSRLHAGLRSRFVPWEGGWRYLDVDRDRDLYAPFDEVLLETWGVMGLLGRSERQRDFLGRIDGWLSPLVPSASRYILFGACRKG